MQEVAADLESVGDYQDAQTNEKPEEADGAEQVGPHVYALVVAGEQRLEGQPAGRVLDAVAGMDKLVVL